MKVVAINASPRRGWNTSILVNEAAEGARSKGADVVHFDLYDLDDFKGCVSCFGCKLGDNTGVCVHRDGLTSVLDEVRTADALIIGTPNYLGEATAAFRAFYERLVFQYITYKVEPRSYNDRRIPVLFIMTSNVPEEAYPQMGYDSVLSKYRQTLDAFIGPTSTYICGDTLQVNDYGRYDWTLFDSEKKKARNETEFPREKREVFLMGSELVRD